MFILFERLKRNSPGSPIIFASSPGSASPVRDVMDSPSSNQVTYNDFKTGHFLLLIGRDEDPRFILLDPDPAHLKKIQIWMKIKIYLYFR